MAKRDIEDDDRLDQEKSPKQARPTIIYEDDALVAVNKPAGVWPREGVLDDPGVFDLFDGVELHQIYPLEMEVSGVALYALTEKAATALTDAFDRGDATLTYHAIVGGSVFTEEGKIDAEINDEAHRDSGLFRVGQYESYLTTWKRLDSFVGYGLIEAIPQQRSQHLVRKHLSAGGLPLAVDALFGGGREIRLSSFKSGYRKSKRRPERPLIVRPSLHAYRVTFPHPDSGERVELTAEYPKDFRATLNQLDRFARMH